MIFRAKAEMTLKLYDMAEAVGMTKQEFNEFLAELLARRLNKGET